MNMKKKFLILIVMQFILSFGLVLPSYSLQQNQNIIAVTPKEAADLTKKHLDDIDFVILDIRTPGEYQSGHLPNSILIDFYSKEFVNKISRLDKKKTYLLYCRSGNRSGRSLDLFRQMKFQQVYHMSNGIIGWTSEGLPVVN
jgi:rhodanese-related sulfurtransferase